MTNPHRLGEGTTTNNNTNIIITNNNQGDIMHQKDDVRSSTVSPQQTVENQIVREWVDCDPIDTEKLLDVDASRIFDEVLPSLADLQPSSQSSSASTSSSSSCCSSCSSSSWAAKDESTDGARSNACGIDSSGGNSFAQSLAVGSAFCSSAMMVQQQQEEEVDGVIDVLDGFGEMDLLDTMDLNWDPSIFPPDDTNTPSHQEEENCFVESEPAIQDPEDQNSNSSQELAQVFFEWLKSNKESISPQDLRSIKLKKSTIESAARRLGGGKEGMLQLLKLILAWVQNHHLQKKQKPSIPSNDDMQNFPLYYQHQQQPYSFPNNSTSSAWFMPPPYHPSSLFNPCMGSFPSAVGYPGNEMCYGLPQNEAIQPFPISSATPNFDTENPSWHQVNHHFCGDQVMNFAYGSNNSTNYNNHPILQQQDCILKSATKEARKKRMARQRRFFFHHRHNNGANEKALMVENDSSNGDGSNRSNRMAWLSSPASDPSSDGPAVQRQTPLDKRQGWKTEKNLRLLLQKVLKQSDVGNLGRIVLPKKEAETHLPKLEARDGISIAMEDIGISRIWNMRYRFWPNNKSRMYLLENTGDFVRSNGLQEGDFIVIYSDVKCGKYMIRGVKVPRQGVNKVQTKGQKSLPHKSLKLTNGEFSSSNME